MIFCDGFSLRRGAGSHAPLDQSRIMLHEIHAERDARADEGDEKQPSLPVAQRAGRREQQHRQKQQENQLTGPSPANERGRSCIHGPSLSAERTTMLTYLSVPLDLPRLFPLEAGHLACG